MDITNIVLFCFAVTGTLLNTISIVLLVTIRKKTLFLKLCLNLAVSDTLQGAFGYSLEVFYRSKRHALFVCKFSSFLVGFFAMTSITFLTLISISRTLAIKKPFLMEHFENKSSFIVLLTFIGWLYPLCWASFPLLGWSSYVLDYSTVRCSINFSPQTAEDKIYLWCLVIFCFLLPVAINFYSFLIAKSSTKKHSQYCAETYGKKNSVTIFVQNKRKRGIALNCCMVAGFLTAWTPYAVLGILSQYIAIPSWLFNSSALLAKSSAIINPLIYCVRLKRKKLNNTSFKKTLERMF